MESKGSFPDKAEHMVGQDSKTRRAAGHPVAVCVGEHSWWDRHLPCLKEETLLDERYSAPGWQMHQQHLLELRGAQQIKHPASHAPCLLLMTDLWSFHLVQQSPERAP